MFPVFLRGFISAFKLGTKVLFTSSGYGLLVFVVVFGYVISELVKLAYSVWWDNLIGGDPSGRATVVDKVANKAILFLDLENFEF